MPIPVTCEACGKSLKVPDKLAGKKAKCPKCREIIRIPGERKSGPMPVETSNDCPSCGRSLGDGDVFCVGCGYDLRTGKKIPGL